MTTATRESTEPATLESPPTGQVLRAIIAKEIRQNLVFVALIFFVDFILVLVLEAFASDWKPNYFRLNQVDLNILLSPYVRTAVPAACAIAAMLIGVFQPLAELSFDRWSFVNHRPVSRSIMFVGRALAGLLLYAAAVGLPLITLLVYASTKRGGQFFLIQYTYPMVADFLAAIGFYFAGLLISERHAKFYGSRFAPLAMAIFGSLAAAFVPRFWMALLVPVVTTVTLCMAAHGSYVTHGYTLRCPAPARRWLVAVLYGVFSLMLLGLGTSVHGTIDRVQWHLLWVRGRIEPTSRPAVEYKEHVVYQDGTLKLRTESTTSHALKDGGEIVGYIRVTRTAYHDAEGREVAAPEVGQLSDQAYYGSVQQFGGSAWHLETSYRETESLASFQTCAHQDKDGNVKWDDVFVFDTTRQIYFVYVAPPWPSEFVGTLGVNGFVAPPGRAEPFPKNSRCDGKTLYKLRLDERKVDVVYRAPEGKQIDAWGRIQFPNLAEPHSSGYLVAIDGELLCVKPGRETSRIPVTHDLRQYDLAITRYPSFHLWQFLYTPRRTDFAIPQRHIVDFTDDDFRVLASDDVTRRPDEIRPKFEWLKDDERQIYRRTEIADGASAAVGNPAMAWVVDWDWALPGGAYSLAGMGLTLLLSGLLTYLAGRMYRLRTRWLWTIAALLTGPATLLTLFATQWWVRRVRCASCGKKRALEAEKCETCGAEWEAPAQNGTEVFAAI